MKILYLSFACNPYAGSEAYCGWAWPFSMREHAEVYVLTRKENLPHIQRYIEENNVKNLHVFSHDIPDWIGPTYRVGKFYLPYYSLWMKTSKRVIKKLHKQYHFDYIHQATLSNYRFVNSSCLLSDTKFIFGPIGNAQAIAAAFEPYVEQEKTSIKIRKFIDKVVCSSPFYKRKLNHCYKIFSANRETQALIQGLIKDKEKCCILSENGVFQDRLCPKSSDLEQSQKKVTLLWAGRMVNTKGLGFLLDVISKVNTVNLFELTIIGEGPAEGSLKEKAQALHISDKINFVGKVPYEEVQEFYKKADIFVFPSFREMTGTVLFEAMSHELPIITFNQSGGAIVVNDQCGIKVEINQSLAQIQHDFAKAIETLVDGADIRRAMGKAAYARMAQDYVWENKTRKFYQEILC